MEGDVITMSELFRFERKGLDADGNVLGELKATGIVPAFHKTLQAKAIDLPIKLFSDGGVLARRSNGDVEPTLDIHRHGLRHRRPAVAGDDRSGLRRGPQTRKKLKARLGELEREIGQGSFSSLLREKYLRELSPLERSLEQLPFMAPLTEMIEQAGHSFLAHRLVLAGRRSRRRGRRRRVDVHAQSAHCAAGGRHGRPPCRSSRLRATARSASRSSRSSCPKPST